MQKESAPYFHDTTQISPLLPKLQTIQEYIFSAAGISARGIRIPLLSAPKYQAPLPELQGYFPKALPARHLKSSPSL